jgi:hypothetical protein
MYDVEIVGAEDFGLRRDKQVDFDFDFKHTDRIYKVG